MSDSPAPLAPASKRSSSGRGVTLETLAVAPDVAGRPLAEPWRRLAAMGVDLLIVTLLSVLSGPWLGLGTGTMLILLFGNSRTAPLPLKIVRIACRGLGAVIVLVSIAALGHVSLVRYGALRLEVFTGSGPSSAMKESIYVAPNASTAELRDATTRLQRQVEALKEEATEWQTASGSWLYQARSFANALGVTFGWSGVYFTLVAGALGGRTVGKFVFGTRAVKINGQPFTFFDAFVRHGGYVAGVAMGLTGFLNLLWDANRRAVEDRIAGTVVLKK